MSAFTQTEIDALYAPFPLEAHTTREGHMNRAKTKVQWFTYLDRAAVQKRLEALFPGEWSVDIIETHRESDYVTVSLKMTIRGISRSCNGGQSLKFDKDTIDEDKEKGAWTEAFRRVASVWGIGLYLYDMDYAIWTDGYESGDWDQQKQRQGEARNKFADWYKRQYPQTQNGGSSRPTPPAPNIPQNPAPSSNGSNGDKPAQPKAAAQPDGQLMPPLRDFLQSPDDEYPVLRSNWVIPHEAKTNGKTTVYYEVEGGATTYSRELFRKVGYSEQDLATWPIEIGRKIMLLAPLDVFYKNVTSNGRDFKQIVKIEKIEEGAF